MIRIKFIITWGCSKIMLTTVKENINSYHTSNTDYDRLWKNLIEELFQEFIQFFTPDLYPEIDFAKEADN